MLKNSQQFGKYRVIKEIEQGNYATVYQVQDKDSNDLILKVARKGIPEFNQLIVREFQILSQFHHPNIVEVYDFDTTMDGVAFFTCEYIKGRPINECFNDFSQEFIGAIIQIINGLGAFHNRGLVHSDLKPEHILYNQVDKKAVIIDFGFAGISANKTNQYGTLGYIAPEVLKGIGMDQRSDLFSLGIIIYEVLTGTRPEKPYRQANNVPDEINGILGRLLVEEPSLRPTAPELYEVFSKYLEKKITIPAYEVRLPPTSFVANKEIMQKLTNIKGETVIVTGETGLGKTRLLKELKYEYLFRDYTGLFFIPGQVGYFHNAVCEFVGYHSLDFSDREDRFQIYAEITERLLEFAQGKKIFIFVDDLNDLDDYELGLFRYIGHSLENSSIAMIGSARPDPRIKDLNFFELGLKEFSAKDTQELLEKTFFKIESENGDTDSLSFSDWLHKQTGGNPLFIVEILRTLYEKRILYYQTDHWHIARDLAEHTEISNEIEGILLMRLKILNPDEIKVLKVLCIVEHPLELSVIQEIVSGAVHLDLEILKMLGLIRDEYVKGRRTLALANQIITTIMKKNIEQDEVNSIIVKTVSAIEGYSPGENEYYPLLARLCEKIGESKKAYDYLLLSAENSDKINDFEQAILFYRKIIDYSKEFEPKRVGGFALRLGDLYLASGDNDSAVNYYKKALDYSDTRTRALFGLGKAYLNAGNYDNSVNNLQCALSEIKNQQSGEYVNTTNWLAYALMYEKEFKKAESLLNQSLKKAQLIESVHLQSEALYYVATLNWFRGEFEKGKENCLELIEFCKQNNLEKQYAYAVNLLSSLYIQTNDIDNGLKYIELAISSFERLKYPNALASALNNKALLLLNSGETKVAMDIFEQSLKISLKIKNRMRESAILTCIADILERTGKFARAHEYYEKALECSPDLYYAISGLVSIYNKRGEFDKALDLLERRLKHNVEAQCLIDTGMVYSVSGDKEKAEQFIKNGLERIENENPEISVKIDAYLGASQFFYEKADFKNSLNYAAKLKKTAPNMFPESWIADVLIKINNFRLGRNKEIDIENELQELKKREFLYDYAYLRRLQIEAMIERGITTEKTKWITDELNSIEEIFNTMEAKIELGKIQEMKLRLFPLIIRDYLTRVISTQYLETFSKLAELISANLGQDDFVKNLLDLIISATNAERGAIFVSTEGKMEFVAGRNIDKRTIRDATELSMTAIEQMSKNQIVFVPNAFDDPNFNIKKSVLLNQIHSILCIPLGIGKKPIGAIYLDSRITGSMFEQKDRDFIICVAKILASVIEKSIAFKSLAQENVVLRTKIISEVGSGYLVGKSRQMKQVYKIVEDISNSNAPVLITGETGTGKGMLARLIHLKSRRRENKFLSINCGAIPETLLESELFGYKKGAFTGAYTDKKGLLEEAESGTVFLDEITNTSPGFQAKILEAIEEKVIRRVGETHTRKIDVRFIFATNKDLEIEVEEGRFRQDLYYRINVFKICIPSLRERAVDIPELAHFFLKKYSEELNKDIQGFDHGVLQKLKEHFWQGNVRELQNVIERAVTLTKHKVITLEDLGFERLKKETAPMSEIKKEAVLEALISANWNIKKAAEILNIHRKTIHRYIKKYQIHKGNNL